MSKKLLKKHEDADYVGDITLWTPDRGKAEFKAGFPEVVGDLLLMSSCVGMGTVKPEHERAMISCLKVIYPEKYAGEK